MCVPDTDLCHTCSCLPGNNLCCTLPGEDLCVQPFSLYTFSYSSISIFWVCVLSLSFSTPSHVYRAMICVISSYVYRAMMCVISSHVYRAMMCVISSYVYRAMMCVIFSHVYLAIILFCSGSRKSKAESLCAEQLPGVAPCRVRTTSRTT